MQQIPLINKCLAKLPNPVPWKITLLNSPGPSRHWQTSLVGNVINYKAKRMVLVDRTRAFPRAKALKKPRLGRWFPG